jgi:hypothetical protein
MLVTSKHKRELCTHLMYVPVCRVHVDACIVDLSLFLVVYYYDTRQKISKRNRTGVKHLRFIKQRSLCGTVISSTQSMIILN